MKKILGVFLVLFIVGGQVFAQSAIDDPYNRKKAVPCPTKSKRKKRVISPKTKTKIQYKRKKVFNTVVDRVKEGVITISKSPSILRERYWGYKYAAKSYKAKPYDVDDGIPKDFVIQMIKDGVALDNVDNKLSKNRIVQMINDGDLSALNLPSQEGLEEIASGLKTGDLDVNEGSEEDWQWGLYQVFNTGKRWIVRRTKSTDEIRIEWPKSKEVSVVKLSEGEILDRKEGETTKTVNLPDGSTTNVEIEYRAALIYFDLGSRERIIMWDQVLLIK